MENQAVNLEVELKERLSDLRQALGKIPGAARKAWYLELFDETGSPLAVFNIKTGRKIRTARTVRQEGVNGG